MQERTFSASYRSYYTSQFSCGRVEVQLNFMSSKLGRGKKGVGYIWPKNRDEVRKSALFPPRLNYCPVNLEIGSCELGNQEGLKLGMSCQKLKLGITEKKKMKDTLLRAGFSESTSPSFISIIALSFNSTSFSSFSFKYQI